MGTDRTPLWTDLVARPPERVCAAADVSTDDSGAYLVPLLGEHYRVCPRERTVRGSGAWQADEDSELIVLAYLARARPIAYTGRWVTPASLPGGDLFFRGPHEPPVGPLLERFGADPSLLPVSALRLGGSRLAFGDAAAELLALPRVPLAIVLWGGDEEFPARASLLVDSSAGDCLPLDLLLALMGIAVRRLVRAADHPPRPEGGVSPGGGRPG